MTRLTTMAAGVALLALPLAAGQAWAQEVVQPLPPAGTDDLNAALRRLARNPRDVGALVDAGDAALKVGDTQGAMGFFGRARDIAPDNARVKMGMAAVFAQTRRPVEALRLFAEAEAAGGDRAAMAADRGLAFDLAGDAASAQENYRLAMTRDQNPELARRLALSQAISGDRSGFEATLLPLLQKRDLAAYRTRAFGLAVLGDVDAAVKIAEGMMPRDMASRMTPYLRYMPQLTKAQQAAAGNLGVFPRAASVGGSGSGAGSASRPAIAARAPTPAPAPTSAPRPSLGPGFAPTPAPRPASAQSSVPAQTVVPSRDPRRIAPPGPAPTPAEARIPAPAPIPILVAKAPSPSPAVAPQPEPKIAAAPVHGAELPPIAAQPAVSPPAAPTATTPVPSVQVTPPPPATLPPASPAVRVAQLEPPAPASAPPAVPEIFEAPAVAPDPAPVAGESEQEISLADAFASFTLPAATDRTASAGAVDITTIRIPREVAAPAPEPEAKKEPVAKPAPKKPAKPAHPARHWVQVATGKNLDALKFDWRRIVKKAGGKLDKKGPFTTPWVEANRLLAGPYDSPDAAKDVVKELKAKGIDSFTFSSAVGEEIKPLG